MQAGMVGKGEASVCLVTGHGFKDPVSVERIAGEHEALTVEVAKLEDTIGELLQ